MKIFIFFIIFFLNSVSIYPKIKDNDAFIKETKILDSLSEEEFYKKLVELNQGLWETYVKEYADTYNLPTSDFPKEIPQEISLRLKAVPVDDLKKMMRDPDKSLEATEKQFRDILDGIRTKKWKPFSMQEWMRAQSGFKKPADQKEIEKTIESKTEKNIQSKAVEKIDLKIEDEEYSFFKQPWFIALAVFIIFVLATAIFKKGK